MSFETRTAGWALYSTQSEQQYAHQHVNANKPKFDALVQNQIDSSETTTEEQFSFGDILDVINPLQHIPILNNIYRELTGDTIKGPAKIAGGGLYGGPIGAMASAASVIGNDGASKANETVLANAELDKHIPDAHLSKEFENVLAKLGQNEEMTFDRIPVMDTPAQVQTKMQDALIKYQAMKQEEFDTYRRMPLL